MGFHSYLQKNNIPFESALALSKTHVIHNHIKQKALEASNELGMERGAAPDIGSTGRRNVYLIAIAPNASSSILCGNTSPSVEPFRANSYSQKTLSGTNIVRNKFLDKIIEDYYCSVGEERRSEVIQETWKDITANGGSIQHIEWMIKEDKDVFKTAIEIDQRWIIEHAAARQMYIDQAQSINLFFPPNVDIRYLSDIHISAWEKGLKTLYYLRSEAASRVENINKKEDKYQYDTEGCIACEG
jgi:ribonucleoside-diphosphate reductase alpha chain